MVNGIDEAIKDICLEIEKCCEIKFLKVETDLDHIHFLVQLVPTYYVTKLVTMIKSITVRQIFKDFPQVKKQLWGGEFWSDGYFASKVGKHSDENMIGKYVQNQGVKQQYKKLHADYQLRMFE